MLYSCNKCVCKRGKQNKKILLPELLGKLFCVDTFCYDACHLISTRRHQIDKEYNMGASRKEDVNNSFFFIDFLIGPTLGSK